MSDFIEFLESIGFHVMNYQKDILEQLTGNEMCVHVADKYDKNDAITLFDSMTANGYKLDLITFYYYKAKQ